MKDSTRAFVNVAVYAPLAFYGLRGKEPPAALLLLAGGYTLLQFFEDLRVLKDARAEKDGASVDGLRSLGTDLRASGGGERPRRRRRNPQAEGAASSDVPARIATDAEVIEFPGGRDDGTD